MYKMLAGLDGVLIALMVAFNGLLASAIGNEGALLAIHFIGLLGTCILLLGSRTKLKTVKGVPIYLFAAGALGIMNVLFNNQCFLALGAAVTLSLNILGQLLASTIIDYFGLLGLKKCPINKTKLAGMGMMVMGMIVMMTL
ncbi:DMT family transporter [Vallitalea pronyensis]|uniref:DMT family transporter n=1 Tax=Vallitalea pronyensis TaxID=1348613 RepID=A0A8J8SIP5_9FIRM|nr:DMT family transporter [Vallitalea pronyensis]QUI24821.1 DMT family transporter [Vallitalea pronyensis]